MTPTPCQLRTSLPETTIEIYSSDHHFVETKSLVDLLTQTETSDREPASQSLPTPVVPPQTAPSSRKPSQTDEDDSQGCFVVDVPSIHQVTAKVWREEMVGGSDRTAGQANAEAKTYRDETTVSKVSTNPVHDRNLLALQSSTFSP
eukprot:768617-Hanusia_phi.AAC.3